MSGYFLRFEIAHETLRSRVTESACQSAADLARNAQRAAVGLWDVDRFDFRRVGFVAPLGQAQQPFARTIDGNLLCHDLWPRKRIGPGQRAAQIFRDIAHVFEARDAAHIDPAPQLVDAHAQLLFRDADFSERCFESITPEPGERPLRVNFARQWRGGIRFYQSNHIRAVSRGAGSDY